MGACRHGPAGSLRRGDRLRPHLLVFTGIDGSGKSSHARYLAASLSETVDDARYVHQFSPENPLVGSPRSLLWDALKKVKALVAKGGQPRPRGPWASLAGTLTLGMGFYRTLAKLRAGRDTPILVFDRYFTDEILRASFDYNFRPRWAWRLEALLPRPHLIFYLDLPPEDALLREKDKDLDPEGIRRKKELYDRWIQGLVALGHPPVVHVRTDREPEEVREEIMAQALHFLAVRGHPLAEAMPLSASAGP